MMSGWIPSTHQQLKGIIIISTHHTRVDGTIRPYRYFNNHDDKVALGPREHSLSVVQ
jgi:hypothetical protein